MVPLDATGMEKIPPKNPLNLSKEEYLEELRIP